jgi:hypothetical protein
VSIKSGQVHTSAFEIEAIEAVLATAGVCCDVVSGAGRARGDFYEVYTDRSYDLIWIAGHGAYNHWDPSSARLLAGDDCAFGINDLCGWEPQSAGRRLLVLNICDGGVSAVLGGMHKLGLAPMLAASGQATVSHFWPVQPWVAAAFGVLLAGELCRSDGFFQAFQRALCLIRTCWTTITQQVSSLAPATALVKRLAHTDQDTGNIFHWGSPCFFQ